MTHRRLAGRLGGCSWLRQRCSVRSYEVLPADAAEELDLILEAVLSGRRRSFEWASASGNGTLDVEAEPIRDGVEGITGAVLVAREPTEARPVRETTAGRA